MSNSERGSVIIIILVLSLCVGAVCWTYAINEWLAWAHREPSCQWWQGALVGLVPAFGQLSIPVAVITWIASMVIG